MLRRGGGAHLDYFVKLYFEIAVEKQTRARDRTFEEVPDSAGQPRSYLVNLWPNFAKKIWRPNFFKDLNQKSASHNKGFYILKRF